MPKILSFDSAQFVKYPLFKRLKDWWDTQHKFIKLTLIISVLLIISTPVIISSYFSLHQVASIPLTTTSTIKVMTYNIAGVNTGDVYGDPTNMIDVLTTYIKDNKIDIVGLQEVDRFASNHKHNGNLVDIYQEIIKSLDAKGWAMESRYAKRFDLNKMPFLANIDGEVGNVILSRYPISNYQTYNLANFDLVNGVNAQRATITIGNANFNIINIHPFPPNQNNIDEKKYDCPVGTINDFVSVLNNQPANKMTLLFGDFNSKFTSTLEHPEARKCVDKIENAGYKEVCGQNPGPDCLDTVNNAFHPGHDYKIDHVFLRKGIFTPFTGEWTIVESHGDHIISISDHYPILSTLSFSTITNSSQNVPIGYHDSSTCSFSTGWACDADSYQEALKIDFYADSPKDSGGVLIGNTTANLVREAAVGSICGGNSSHGFSFATPTSLNDGKSHKIYAYAIDSIDEKVNLLNDSPKTIVCGVGAAQDLNVNLLPLGDSYVTSVNPRQNYGKSIFLKADSNPSSFGFLKFDTSAYKSKIIKKVVLELTVAETDNAQSALVKGLDVRVISNNWLDTFLTYNNRPVFGSIIATHVGAVSLGQKVRLDITDYIKSHLGIVSFALVNRGTDGVVFKSSENSSDKPKLKITYQ